MFDPNIAQVRFGFGRAAGQAGPRDLSDVLTPISAPDAIETAYSAVTTRTALQLAKDHRRMVRSRNKEEPDANTRAEAVRDRFRTTISQNFRTIIARATLSQAGFRERLVSFWTNHFTVAADNRIARVLIFSQINDAIRPHVHGRFADLLKAADLHPAMLLYLNQQASFGPNSALGKRRGRGLNENLAREMLELHTVGVGGGYSQTDVRELAELLTGVYYDGEKRFFRPRAAEPGSETIMGRTYGGERERFAHIEAFLEDISIHPNTARFLARKLVVHFISDEPDEGLINAMAQEYLAQDGSLMALYEVMLSHPLAWSEPARKIKQPFDYVVSVMRILGVGRAQIDDLTPQALNRRFVTPLRLMGQDPFRPTGPDGWSEKAEYWITPVNLAGRVQWATEMARWYGRDHDPRIFVDAALGTDAPANVRLAATRAESRREGIALVLASPQFNRR